MTQNSSFVRKVIYIGCIALLLIPLSMLGRPTTMDSLGNEKDPGGVIAQVRNEYRLSQAKLGDIDPASESMKLATLGLRGIASMLLWNKAHDFQEQENWDGFAVTLNQIANLQPNFVSVWVYQAHNLSYNVSREFDDYQARYSWVKRGMDYLMVGISFNRLDPRILSNLGMFFGQKFGRSDEKDQFRRLFRSDTEYHEKLRTEGVNIESADQGFGGPDNWLVAKQWYDKARDLVDNKGIQPRLGPLQFYKEPAVQLRNYAMAIESEFRPDEKAQQAWSDALEAWLDYGNREIRHSFGTLIRLRQLHSQAAKVLQIQDELGKLNPEVYSKLMAERKSKFADGELEAFVIDADQRTVEQQQLAHNAMNRLFLGELDAGAIMQGLSAEDARKADRLIMEMLDAKEIHRQIKGYRTQVNYDYWLTRCRAEREPDAVLARAALFDAQKLIDETKVDRYVVVDEVTGERVEEDGAKQKFELAFRLWAKIRNDHPMLAVDSANADDLISTIRQYYALLKSIGEEFPLDFPLQALIDERGQYTNDGLPTSDHLELRRVNTLPSFSDRYGSEDETGTSTDNGPSDVFVPPVAPSLGPKADDGKNADGKNADAKNADAKNADAKNADAKDADAKETDAPKRMKDDDPADAASANATSAVEEDGIAKQPADESEAADKQGSATKPEQAKSDASTDAEDDADAAAASKKAGPASAGAAPSEPAARPDDGDGGQDN